MLFFSLVRMGILLLVQEESQNVSGQTFVLMFLRNKWNKNFKDIMCFISFIEIKLFECGVFFRML